MKPQLHIYCFLAVIGVAASGGLAVPPAPADAQREFNITAGNAFFDHTPALGVVCTFDFGDPKGSYNILTGYNAAHIYQTPGNYTLTVRRKGQADEAKNIHVLPDHRAVQVLQLKDRFTDIIRALPNDTIVLLPPGSTWDVSGPLEIKARNVSFRPSAKGPAPRIRRVAGIGSTSLVPTGLDISFQGIEFDSDKDMKVVGDAKTNYRGLTPDTAHLVALNCTFRNIDDAFVCSPLTRGLLVQGCTFTDEMRACNVWCGGTDIVLLGNKMGCSQREHNVRCSDPHFTNLLLYDNDITATQGKETLTFRQGQDLYASHNAFHGWVRTGPGPRGDHRYITAEELKKVQVRYAVIEDNRFDHGWLQINEGASFVTVRQNTFEVNTSLVPIRVQGPSVNHIMVEENCRVLMEGPTQKPLVRAWETGEGDIVERSNTVKSSEVKPDAPHPSSKPAVQTPKSE